MTLSPFESREVTDADLPPYEVNTVCAWPDCEKPAMEKHHLSRRSAGTTGYWVKVVGFRNPIPNIVGLCNQHHGWVTASIGGHKARIVYREGQFWAFTFDPHNFVFSPLDPQPFGVQGPELSSEVECPACHAVAVVREERRDAGLSKDEQLTKLPPRLKRTYAFAVPKDHYENGYEIINTLLGEAAKILGRSEHVSWKYYTIVECLHDFVSTNAGREAEVQAGVGG